MCIRYSAVPAARRPPAMVVELGAALARFGGPPKAAAAAARLAEALATPGAPAAYHAQLGLQLMKRP